MRKTLLIIAALLAGAAAEADTPADLLRTYQSESGASSAPSAAAGDKFFHERRKDWSCATCHTADPRAQGRHAVTGKAIAPLAPAADPRRFTDRAKAEKWFKRNCNDVVGRECTAAEKADVIAYLASLRP